MNLNISVLEQIISREKSKLSANNKLSVNNEMDIQASTIEPQSQSKIDFVHLHVHADYSILDGMCRIPELVRMAKELGMNPRKLGSLANHKQEPWKAPLPEFIEELYRKRFRRVKPLNEKSL